VPFVKDINHVLDKAKVQREIDTVQVQTDTASIQFIADNTRLVRDDFSELSPLALFLLLLNVCDPSLFFFPVYKLNTEISAYRFLSGYLSYHFLLFLYLHHSCLEALRSDFKTPSPRLMKRDFASN